jgi:hypothetical protein
MAWTQRGLLCQAALLVAATRLGLLVLPFPTLWGLLGRLIPPAPDSVREADATTDRICQAVERAGRALPAGGCLAQALAAQVLLARAGVPTQLRIGVARSAGAPLRAHAWLERDGCVILGGSDKLARFTPFPPLGPARR